MGRTGRCYKPMIHKVSHLEEQHPIPWELRDANPHGHAPKPTESETLGIGPRNLPVILMQAEV